MGGARFFSTWRDRVLALPVGMHTPKDPLVYICVYLRGLDMRGSRDSVLCYLRPGKDQMCSQLLANR